MTIRRKNLLWVKLEAGSYEAVDGRATYYAYRERGNHWKAVRTTPASRTVVAQNCKTLAMARRGAEAHAAKEVE
jgi:hypothetical protein